MKDIRFDGIAIPIDSVSPEFLKVISLVADKEYSEALDTINEFISEVKDTKYKNIAAMMSLQILALAGYEEIASVLLKALLKNFKAHSKEKCLCQRTINNIYNK